MWIKILLAVILILVIFAIFVATRPSDFKVSRSKLISAPPEVVFAQVNDLRAWEAWSPWAKLDPNAKMTYEGPQQGVGAVAKWDGNNEVGAGTQTLTESRPNELVHFHMEFVRPFKGTSEVEFVFLPQGNQTEVTWNMASKSGFLAKAVGIFMNCEKMCGDQFNNGLTGLKQISEAKSQPSN